MSLFHSKYHFKFHFDVLNFHQISNWPNTARKRRNTARLQRGSQRNGRRKGVVYIYIGLAIFVFFGVAALSVDMGNLYARRAKAQRAADSAALAGVYQLATGGDDAQANASALKYAASNGYKDKDGSVVVTTTPKWQGNPNWFHVTVKRTEPLFFGGFLGRPTIDVGASATGQYLIEHSTPQDPKFYGTKNGPVTYSVFGPDGLHSNGDKYSVTQLNNGKANPDYDGKGYNFPVGIPANYQTLNGTSKVQVELFDPDTHNKDDKADADGLRVDELRGKHSSGAGNSGDATTTQYSLIWDKDGNPNNPDASDHVLITDPVSFGDDATTDMQWHTPDGFTFDSNLYQGGSIRVNVTTTAGSSENGFNLRAGPPHDTDKDGNSVIDDTAWHEKYSGAEGSANAGNINGTTVSALGKLPMNFNINGTADVFLGDVPKNAAGGAFTIAKFDTDVGAKSLYYTCDSLPGQTFKGTLAGNDKDAIDTIKLPADYQGGNWHAIYTAGSQDTSSWYLTYTKGGGVGSNIRLVQ